MYILAEKYLLMRFLTLFINIGLFLYYKYKLDKNNCKCYNDVNAKIIYVLIAFSILINIMQICNTDSEYNGLLTLLFILCTLLFLYNVKLFIQNLEKNNCKCSLVEYDTINTYVIVKYVNLISIFLYVFVGMIYLLTMFIIQNKSE